MSEYNLKKLEFSPDANPFGLGAEVPIKQKFVRSGLQKTTLADAATGELVATSTIHQIEHVDSDHFVKVFSAGIAATYELTKTGQRTFQAILQIYENAPMSGGFVDAIYLAWFDDGLSGQKLDMSEKTFQRGLKELLERGFLSPKAPNLFWVNPALFFRGDRVLFLKEYRRTKPKAAPRVESQGTAPAALRTPQPKPIPRQTTLAGHGPGKRPKQKKRK